MKLRKLIPLTVFLLATATSGGRADDDGEPPRLEIRTVLSRAGNYYNGHLEFSRDGRTLFSFGPGQRRVHVWDVASEKETASLWQDGNRLYAFAYSPNGKLLATARGRGSVWIWDAHTAKKLRAIEGPESIARLIFGSDSESLSAVAQGKLYVCRVKKDEEFRLQREINPGPAYDVVHPVASSGPAKKPLLVCGNRLFDAVTGVECYRLWEGKFDSACTVPHVAITSDGKKIANGGQAFITLWDWSPENENPAFRKRLVLEYPTMVFHCLSFSPNNQVLAVGYEDEPRPGVKSGGILFFDAASGKLLYKQGTGTFGIHALAFSPDGRVLATGDHVGPLKLWDVPAAWRKKAK